MEQHRRNRKPTQHGTCQVCGDVVALAVSAEPHRVIKHGYVVIEGRDKVPCAGSGYPPIEVSRERGDALATLYRQQLKDLRSRRVDGAAPPIGLSGASALRARFSVEPGKSASEEVCPAVDPRLLARIAETERQLRVVENTLVTGSSTTKLRPKVSPTHRINSIFRRNKDAKVYIVESMDMPVQSPRSKNRRLAHTYLCRNVETGERIRITQNELTRALNDEGIPLVRGKPADDLESSSAAA